MKKNLILIAISILVLIAIGTYQYIKSSDNKLHIVFCNVGQGDGIYIHAPNGADIIVDGGPGENSMTDCLSRHMPFWDRTIEAVFLTHPDADHLSGLIAVAQTYKINFFGTSKAPKDTEVYNELMSTLKEKGVVVHWIYLGDILRIKGGLQMTTYWPTHEFILKESSDTNDYSLVQLITYGKFRALLTGDVPFMYLDPIMPQIEPLTLFKPPHHGSKTGIDGKTFLSGIPQIAVLSFGYHNRYHHPAPEVINFLQHYHIPYKNTLNGDIEVISDGKKWLVN